MCVISTLQQCCVRGVTAHVPRRLTVLAADERLMIGLRKLAAPMLFQAGDREYVVIAVGGNDDGGWKGDYVISFALER